MALYYCLAMLIASLLILVVYVFIFHKHFDASITIMAVLIPVVNLGHFIIASSSVIQEALVGLKLTYIGGCFVTLSALFLVFNICRVNIKAWIRAILVVISSVVIVSSLTIGRTSLFYKTTPTLAFSSDGVGYITDKQYGVMHTIFYIVVIAYYLAAIATLVYCFFKKKQVSNKVLILVVLTVTIAFIGFFGGRLFTKWIGHPEFELLPLTYNLGMGLYLLIASRLRLYDASDSVTDSLVEKGDIGFVSFDYKTRYLGSNDTARNMFHEISHYVVDKEIKDFPIGKEYILTLVESFKKDPNNNKCFVKEDDKVYLMQMNELKVGRFSKGYQLLISDDTKNQEFIKLIKNYNSELEKEVKSKTGDILDLQNRFILGMATMVEGRDNSTGGHIRRTSDCVRFLIEAMKEEHVPGLNDMFCFNVVRAAPMHDLGKITIDDAILRKPGKFTPEEYAVMKTHSAEGARIISEILEGASDKEFLKIAINVAHYHHERWDGSGYPDGLKGKEIPFEARIMAIADVYDALVSKRVYKEEFSFEEANKIIMDGFGSQFDPSLEKSYLRARDKIENYYRQLKK